MTPDRPPTGTHYAPHRRYELPLRDDPHTPDPFEGLSWRELVYMVPAAIVCVELSRTSR